MLCPMYVFTIKAQLFHSKKSQAGPLVHGPKHGQLSNLTSSLDIQGGMGGVLPLLKSGKIKELSMKRMVYC